MSKVKFGLKNAHYALATINSDGTATYGEPKKLPGAVSINLDPAGEATNFYADDQVYYTIDGASGYTGTLELALIPDDFRKDCLGETADAAGVLVESANNAPAVFALLFEFTTDDKALRHVMYNCTATRPSIAGSTKGETAEMSTETLNLKVSTIFNSSLDEDVVKAKADKSSSAYSGWYSTVYQPTSASV